MVSIMAYSVSFSKAGKWQDNREQAWCAMLLGPQLVQVTTRPSVLAGSTALAFETLNHDDSCSVRAVAPECGTVE